MCVDLNYPTFRFFATQLEEDTDAQLAIDVIYPALAEKNVRAGQAVPAQDQGRVGAQRRHQARAAAPRQAVGWRKVAIRFRVEPGKKAASYRIDDVLIDPRRLY